MHIFTKKKKHKNKKNEKNTQFFWEKNKFINSNYLMWLNTEIFKVSHDFQSETF